MYFKDKQTKRILTLIPTHKQNKIKHKFAMRSTTIYNRKTGLLSCTLRISSQLKEIINNEDFFFTGEM